MTLETKEKTALNASVAQMQGSQYNQKLLRL